MRTSRSTLLLGSVLFCSASLLYLGMSGVECPPKSHRHRWMEMHLSQSANQNQTLSEHFPEDTPLIFIGGFPRSGTTLMRVMLDAHNAVRCGEETRVIPRLLAMRATWSRSVKERIRLDEAGVTDQVIVGHGEPAPRLCNKDPFALKSLSYLSHIFPKAKFVLMVRDGRAAVHSMISRKAKWSGSTDQVVKPVNTEALSKWVGNIPSDVLSDMAEIAPMLSRLGYDPHANPPDYSRPESLLPLYNLSRAKPTH
ncbi:hypothetical protein WMY93_008096 [Mugilogobius chulae]|uniref:Protein-tyrosine sulfotransferase n=1 Tax=Mugilogobius chulae TaxID=88201 RepID=A0AAW0PF45_9GOBI